MEFKAFPDDEFVGFYASMTKDGTAIKTLGAIIDSCALASVADTLKDLFGT